MAYERQYDAHIDARLKWLEEVNQPAEYRALGNNVLAFRKKARHGLSEMSLMARRGYGNAVLSAIRGKQAMALRRATPGVNARPNCASGTFEQDGNAILKAVAAQNKAKCLRDRDFNQAEAYRKYEEAMAEKHGSCEWREAA